MWVPEAKGEICQDLTYLLKLINQYKVYYINITIILIYKFYKFNWKVILLLILYNLFNIIIVCISLGILYIIFIFRENIYNYLFKYKERFFSLFVTLLIIYKFDIINYGLSNILPYLLDILNITRPIYIYIISLILGFVLFYFVRFTRHIIFNICLGFFKLGSFKLGSFKSKLGFKYMLKRSSRETFTSFGFFVCCICSICFCLSSNPQLFVDYLNNHKEVYVYLLWVYSIIIYIENYINCFQFNLNKPIIPDWRHNMLPDRDIRLPPISEINPSTSLRLPPIVNRVNRLPGIADIIPPNNLQLPPLANNGQPVNAAVARPIVAPVTTAVAEPIVAPMNILQNAQPVYNYAQAVAPEPIQYAQPVYNYPQAVVPAPMYYFPQPPVPLLPGPVDSVPYVADNSIAWALDAQGFAKPRFLVLDRQENVKYGPYGLHDTVCIKKMYLDDNDHTRIARNIVRGLVSDFCEDTVFTVREPQEIKKLTYMRIQGICNSTSITKHDCDEISEVFVGILFKRFNNLNRSRFRTRADIFFNVDSVS